MISTNATRLTRSRWPHIWIITIVGLCFLYRPLLGQRATQSRANHEGQAQSNGSIPQLTAGAQDQSPAHKYFTDVELISQNGEKMRFYTDLLEGKVVIINSFFGTCQGFCLPINHKLERVQQALGEHMGKDVRIISITVDPTVDTPANLKKYAEALHAKRGRYFLTGDKENVNLALSKLGQYVENKEDHLGIVIIGNERTGLWKKALGLADSDELLKIVENVLNDRPSTNK